MKNDTPEQIINSFDYIIFDLGGVILNLNYQLTVEAFARLVQKDTNWLYSTTKQHNFFSDFEMGKISAHDFRQRFKQLTGCDSLNNDAIDAAWNAMLLDLPMSRINYLEELKVTKNIFLLSNINEIHEAAFNKILQNSTNNKYQTLDNLFHKVYFSHRIGLRKPDLAAFQLIIDENKLIPTKTLFVDDSLQHINAAKSLGLQTLHMTRPLQV